MITTYFKNLIMDHTFHTSAGAVLPEKYYLGWSTAIPGEDGAGFTEPNQSTGYSRIELTGLNNAVDGTIENVAKLAFSEATSHQGLANEYGVFDSLAVGSGNLLIFDELDAGEGDEKKTVEKGTTLSFKSQAAKFTLKGL